ncbi:hypothetical protein [Methylobacterium sp. ID0610]|uniref:hypothetical protein n=1 Tax=Methylobacterium carpenticola TaxID=3344827 RepID=UPI0036ADE5AD
MALRHLGGLVLAAGAVLILNAGPALAASCGRAIGLPARTLIDFNANPTNLLTETANVAGRVTAIVSADTNTTAAVLRVAHFGDSDQKAGVGKGLARAALACREDVPAETTAIQDRVIAANEPEILRAFLLEMSEAPGLTGAVSGPSVSRGARTARGSSGGDASGGAVPRTVSSVPIAAPDTSRSSGTTRASSFSYLPSSYHPSPSYYSSSSYSSSPGSSSASSVSPSFTAARFTTGDSRLQASSPRSP